MSQRTNAEIPDRPSDPVLKLDENVPVWPSGKGKPFSGKFPTIPDVKNMDLNSVVQLMLPKIVYAEAGMECRIYYRNLVLACDQSMLRFSVQCPIGTAGEQYWSATPEMTGDFPFFIEVKDRAGRVLGSAETVIKVASQENGNDRNLVVMIVGDSIMGNGKVADYLLEGMMSRGNSNLRLMGSHSGNGAPLSLGKAAVEAYGGWSWDTFMTLWNPGEEYNKRTKLMKMSGDTLVPAVREYLEKYNGGKAPDIVIFYLGCNDIACANMGTIEKAIERSVANRDKLIAMVRDAMPDALFGCALLAPANGREEAFEINYKGSIPRRQYLYNQFSYTRRMLIDLQDSAGLSVIPFFPGVDVMEDYPEDNAVHPVEKGQRRLAQMLEAWLKNILPEPESISR